jgi:hypothetical protein
MPDIRTVTLSESQLLVVVKETVNTVGKGSKLAASL